MNGVIRALAGYSYEVAVGLLDFGFLLLAVYWLTTPVRRVLAVCSVVRYFNIRDLRDGKWPKPFRSFEASTLP